MMAVKHAPGPVSQELSSLREDLAASCHRVLGHKAARWSRMLQRGGFESTASHRNASPATGQCCGFSLHL